MSAIYNSVNELIREYTDRIRKKIGFDNAVLFTCLLILAAHYFSRIGGASDWDEEGFFYITSAVSRGQGLYADLRLFYPPIFFYIGAVFFKVFSNIYYAMLSARIFVTLLSLAGMYLIFDMFRKMKLSLFIIPAALFMLYSMQLDLLVIKYRPDHAICFILVLQAYLIFLLSIKNRRSDLNVFLIVLLGVISFHVHQKVSTIEIPLMMAFLLCYFEVIKRFILRYWKAIISVSSLALLYAIFSPSYHRFFYCSYIFLPDYVKAMDRWHNLTFGNNMYWLTPWLKHNIAFWLTGLASGLTFLFCLKRSRTYLFPLSFLVGALIININGLLFTCPYLQYQLYVVWGILYSLPYFVKICCEAFPKRRSLIFLVMFSLALSGYFTYGHYIWPSKPLKTYAAEIDLVRDAIGKDGLASMGGAAINIPTTLPYPDIPGLHDDYMNVRDPLIKNASKFVLLDQRLDIKYRLSERALYAEDAHFIGANYQKCHGLPLMIASKWVYVDADLKDIPVEIRGNYKVLLFRRPDTNVMIDGRALKNIQVMYLERGRHALKADGPAAILIEYNSDRTSSESLYNLGLSGYEFIPLRESFSGVFELLGVLRYERSNKLFYRLFWRVRSPVNDDLMAFQHFCDSSGNYVDGANIDPADGWYNLKILKKGDVISYDLSVDKNYKFRYVHIGWYYKRDWTKRLPYDGTTFYIMKL